MNVLPQQLIGKVIYDCYESDKNKLTIEFTDGTKLVIPIDYFYTMKGHYHEQEVILRLSPI